MERFLLIAIGGALGSVLRFAIARAMQGHPGEGFPYGTLAVNTIGCFAIGLLAAGFAGPWPVRESLRLGVIVGVLGGFTTYSAFALETVELLRHGRPGMAALYVLLSNGLGVAAAAGGWMLVGPVTRAGGASA